MQADPDEQARVASYKRAAWWFQPLALACIFGGSLITALSGAHLLQVVGLLVVFVGSVLGFIPICMYLRILPYLGVYAAAGVVAVVLIPHTGTILCLMVVFIFVGAVVWKR